LADGAKVRESQSFVGVKMRQSHVLIIPSVFCHQSMHSELVVKMLHDAAASLRLYGGRAGKSLGGSASHRLAFR
jgi:hypothetical protein